MEAKAYDAFISYSHQDLKWGKWLQRRLENYRIPREFRQNGKHLHIFRDQTDLAGVELHSSLQRALEASRFLIVICSPASAVSPWVAEEIRAFRELGGTERIIPFVVDGEPMSDDPEKECFPEALRNLEDMELLGTNIQEIGKNKALLKILSVLLDVRLNRLTDRDRQRRVRKGLIIGGAGLIATAFTVGIIWRNAVISQRNRELAYDNYAAILLTGKSLRQDEFTGEDVGHLKASAEAGNDQAMLLLADCCLHGWGMEESPEEAVSWLTRAARAGNTDAMRALSLCCMNGTGTAVDEKEAFSWTLQAAEKGNPDAMNEIGNFYESGYYTPQDYLKAFEWYRAAAEKGHEMGLFNLAMCHFLGLGTEVNPEKGFETMKKLADTGNPNGMYFLGMLYQEGNGTAQNSEQAFTWYRRAAEAGSAEGMYKTGWCIENGYGVENPAIDWYKAAAEAGNQDAAEALRRLEESAEEGSKEGSEGGSEGQKQGENTSLPTE